jgi:dTMP kinase
VLCDRFVHSTLAYQGGGNGLDQALLRGLHDFAAGGLWPDLVVWLDVAPDLGLARAAARRAASGQTLHDRFEDRGQAFHERVRAAFAALAAEDPRVHRIDGAADPEAVAAAVAAVVLGRSGG